MKEFLNKRNIINLLLLGIMVLAIPLTVKLARQQQILFSRAAEAQIVFLTKELGGTTVPNDPNNSSCVITRKISGSDKLVTLCKDVKVKLVAPTGADIKFQGRTSLLPQGGLVSTVYAGHLGYEANFCEGNSIVHEYPNRDHEVQHNCSDDEVCKDLPNNDAGCEAKTAPTPAPTAEPTAAPTEVPAPTAAPTAEPTADCTNYTQTCTGGTTIQCHNGVSENDRCVAGSNSHCDSDCPAGDGLIPDTCKNDPVTPPSGYRWKADCSSPCNDNSQCPKGVNNQDGWCYGFSSGNRCLQLETAGGGGVTEGTCKNDPVTPPAGYKWTADCSKSCSQNSDCPKGANNQDGWCYGFANNTNRCLKLESVGGATGDGVCRNNPVTPPSGYKWTADCSKSCTSNDQCPRGANNQEGWCYGFANNTNRCLKLEIAPSGDQKCFACDTAADGKSRYRYAGSPTGDVSKCPANAPVCDPKTLVTCKGPDNLKEDLCNTAAVPTITKYRVAQQANELENAQFKPYPGGAAGVIEDISFSDTTPGQNKCVFVQFKDSAENITERKNECITYVGSDPKITGATCNLDITDNSLRFQADGDNFGARDLTNSHLAADNSNLEIKEWVNQKVVARMANPPDTTTGKTYVVTLTRSDGTKATASCSVNTTQISLGARLFCRAPSSFDQDNVKLTIVQNALGVGVTAASGNFQAGSKARETVTISKEGVISNLKTKLQEGLDYIACIKAPKSLRLCTRPFTAVAGNNIITHRFDLPVGDVNDDEAINSADASICKAEWGPARAGRTKVCEFNRDNVTNSFEWSCLLHDFNAPNQPEP